ncbi:hypothetical protein AVI51_16350 (plasmid) [Piscirickettsia salmonis]|uniref:hypothetical protein n=1 Tax=Piscirickettsia salmonis TaxID=1238 RepID=UPI0006BCDB00|nr:hypothetical protein [Piscirickettsia salmonis]ALA26719.1 transposase [Piscirickettsia salmonis]APS52552.1 hypothetical protein AVI50_17030 [Piscirickettsia salmonis]APS55678.1 hypothetical protein AVI51_16350 [Piscirickettsia salmonis]QGP34530.1 hypothetical protein Psal161_03562 [Piscirickettsia salmonis]
MATIGSLVVNLSANSAQLVKSLTKAELASKNFSKRKRRYLGRYFAHPMMQNRRAKRDDYKPSAVRVTQRCVP